MGKPERSNPNKQSPEKEKKSFKNFLERIEEVPLIKWIGALILALITAWFAYFISFTKPAPIFDVKDATLNPNQTIIIMGKNSSAQKRSLLDVRWDGMTVNGGIEPHAVENVYEWHLAISNLKENRFPVESLKDGKHKLEVGFNGKYHRISDIHLDSKPSIGKLSFPSSPDNPKKKIREDKAADERQEPNESNKGTYSETAKKEASPSQPPDKEPETISKPKWADILGNDQYGTYADFSIKGVVQRMRWIKPGRFLMGSPKDEAGRSADETQHEVVLTEGFWLADTECTQQLWQAVMGDNLSRFNGPQRPVDQVSWDDCQIFIQKMKQLKPDLELCLPSDAQWEYACRAGTKTPFSFGDNITSEQVNYDGNYPYADGKKGENRKETVDVKSLPCNKWGLFQMHGNVWEWCADWYGNYSAVPIENPTGPDKGHYRVLRGGSWVSYGWYVRSADRIRNEPSLRSSSMGVRFASGQFEHRQ